MMPTVCLLVGQVEKGVNRDPPCAILETSALQGGKEPGSYDETRVVHNECSGAATRRGVDSAFHSVLYCLDRAIPILFKSAEASGMR